MAFTGLASQPPAGRPVPPDGPCHREAAANGRACPGHRGIVQAQAAPVGWPTRLPTAGRWWPTCAEGKSDRLPPPPPGTAAARVRRIAGPAGVGGRKGGNSAPATVSSPFPRAPHVRLGPPTTQSLPVRCRKGRVLAVDEVVRPTETHGRVVGARYDEYGPAGGPRRPDGRSVAGHRGRPPGARTAGGGRPQPRVRLSGPPPGGRLLPGRQGALGSSVTSPHSHRSRLTTRPAPRRPAVRSNGIIDPHRHVVVHSSRAPSPNRRWAPASSCTGKTRLPSAVRMRP
jgi:hypothetical protein